MRPRRARTLRERLEFLEADPQSDEPTRFWSAVLTKSEFHELVEFLGDKFQRIDVRFERMETRLDATEEAVRHNGVLIEQNTDAIRTVAEGVVMVNDRLDRFRLEFEARPR
jgi:hypothetical protein